MKLLASVLWTMAALAVTWLVAVDSASEQSCKRYSDGCSTPAPLPCQEYFRPACDRHDSCYRCGKTFGISRTKCDSAFYDDMSTLCENLGFFDICPARRKREVASGRATPIARSTPWKNVMHQKSFLNREARVSVLPFTTCLHWASIYHAAVKLAGASSYSETVNQRACEELKPCLPNH
nr:venom-related protein conodipine [Conus judaeus]